MSIASVAALSADQVMANAGKTFHRAARLLPSSIRSEVVQLYAFCRRVDDLADEPVRPLPERRRSLIELAQALEEGNQAVLRSNGWSFSSRGVLPSAAALLVRAALGDLDQHQPQTQEELLEYAFGVAGTVGVMMAVVLRATLEGFGGAVALGMAMQLSNICRDVAEDLHAGRVYLPLEWISEEAVRRAINLGDNSDVRVAKAVIRCLLGMAEDLYEAAYDHIWSLPWRIRWSILAAGMCYREIGVKVGHDIERSWRERTVVSHGRKLWLIALAGARLALPRFWRRSASPHWPTVLGSAALAHGRALGLTG